MRKSKLISAVGVLLSLGLMVQVFSFSGCNKILPEALFTMKILGGLEADKGIGIAADGSEFIMVGTSWNSSTGLSDLLMYRLNSKGTELDSVTFGGAGNESAKAMLVTEAGEIIVAGSKGDSLLLVKFGSNFSPIWERTISSSTSGISWAEEVIETSDGGFLLAGGFLGTTSSEGSQEYLVRTNSLGEVLWSNVFGGGQNDTIAGVWENPTTGEIMFFSSRQDDEGKAQVFQGNLTSAGNPLASKTFETDSEDHVSDLTPLSDGLLITGTRFTTEGDTVLFAWKVSYTGDSLWQFQSSSDNASWGESAMENSDGSIVLIGSERTDASGSQLSLTKIDNTGTLVWNSLFGHSGTEVGNDVVGTPEGGYITVGTTSSATVDMVWLMQVDENGE